MKHRYSPLICAIIIALTPCSASAQKNRAAKAIITLITGGAAAEAAKRTVGATLDYDTAREALRKQGCDITDAAVYSLYLSLNGDVSSMWWEDIFSKPDIFAVVSIEGRGQFLIPEIYNNYSGQPILLNVIAKQAAPGKRIVVTIYDDDTAGDAVWNSILQSRINYSVGGTFQASQAFRLDGNIHGQLRVLDRNVVIDAPDFIATAEFKVPRITFTQEWVAKGPIVDSSGRTLGELSFTHVLSPGEAPGAAMKSSLMNIAFWGTITLVCLAVFGKLLFSRWSVKKIAV